MGTLKKVYLVTWSESGNYGTVLQCFALMHKIRKMNYDVMILNPFQVNRKLKSRIKAAAHYMKIYDLYHAVKLFREIQDIGKFRKLYQFEKKYFKERNIYTRKQYEHLLKENAVFCTGSDQIWNTYYSYSDFYFLSFAGSCRRAAYSSSIGTNKIHPKALHRVRKHLSKFNYIGVREEETVSVLKKLLNRQDIVHVLDPVLLLSDSEWNQILSDVLIEVNLPDRYIICYFVGNSPDYKKQLAKISRLLGIKNIVEIVSAEYPGFSAGGNLRYRSCGPEEFVYLISHAAFVCTDSFHATAFSILYKKQFVTLKRFRDNDKMSQNVRIYSLLRRYHLEEHIYSESSLEWMNDIDYDTVYAKLEQDRKFSLDFLRKALGESLHEE